LAVGAGGALGAMMRHWVGIWWKARLGSDFPWHTLLINVTGSLALGLIMSASLGRDWPFGWRLFAVVGVCGGYTTFSSFSGEAARLFEEGALAQALGYVAGSCLLCICGCLAGVHLGRIFWPPAGG